MFDFFSLLVVDLMHEFELGVWKALFVHLIRILVAQGGIAIQEFNARCVGLPLLLISIEILIFNRYRQVETFGRSTIRRFDANTSALKKLAARNYEDALQVCGVYEIIFKRDGS